MGSMGEALFFILLGSVVVGAFARWRGIPAPLLITVVAIPASFIPLFSNLNIDGHLLLTIVLPPLLYSAAQDVSLVSFRRSLPQIGRLGVGLVLVTTVAVAAVAYLIMPDLTIPGALLLGAIVAPPDAVSAATIGRKLGLPRRLMAVISGESLINDATSLTLYRVFAAMVAGAALTVWDGIGQFLLAVSVGISIGLVLGFVVHQLRLRIGDAVVSSAVGLIVPFGSYAIAEYLGGSGVLAVVAMGLYVGFHSPRAGYTTRMQEGPVWLSVDFLLESFVFAYIGLQFPQVLQNLGAEAISPVLWLAGAVFLVVLVVRPLFVFPSAWWGAWLAARAQRHRHRAHTRAHPAQSQGHSAPEEAPDGPIPASSALTWQENAVVSWAGMRGVVTLATALAVADLSGIHENAAHAIVVVAFVVTVGTLLFQGTTLPWLIGRLGVVTSVARAEQEQDQCELAALRLRTRAAGAQFLAAQREHWLAVRGPEAGKGFDALARTLARIELEADRLQGEGEAVAGGLNPADHADLLALFKGWLAVRRETLLAQRDSGELGEEVMRETMAAIDAQELAVDAGGPIQQYDPS